MFKLQNEAEWKPWMSVWPSSLPSVYQGSRKMTNKCYIFV